MMRATSSFDDEDNPNQTILVKSNVIRNGRSGLRGPGAEYRGKTKGRSQPVLWVSETKKVLIARLECSLISCRNLH